MSNSFYPQTTEVYIIDDLLHTDAPVSRELVDEWFRRLENQLFLQLTSGSGRHESTRPEPMAHGAVNWKCES